MGSAHSFHDRSSGGRPDPDERECTVTIDVWAQRLPPSLVDFMRGRGAGRVMFGTNWPMLSASRALEGLDGLGLDAGVRHRFLHDNAAGVFGLSTT